MIHVSFNEFQNIHMRTKPKERCHIYTSTIIPLNRVNKVLNSLLLFNICIYWCNNNSNNKFKILL